MQDGTFITEDNPPPRQTLGEGFGRSTSGAGAFGMPSLGNGITPQMWRPV
jgi:hypothetical protein